MSESQKADMRHVAYKGEAPMMQDLIGGQIQMAYASALQAKPYIDAGKLKAIGVTGEQRISVLPNVPTLVEQGLKDEVYRVTGWLCRRVEVLELPIDDSWIRDSGPIYLVDDDGGVAMVQLRFNAWGEKYRPV